MVMTPNLLLMMVAMMIVTVLLVAGVVLVEQWKTRDGSDSLRFTC